MEAKASRKKMLEELTRKAILEGAIAVVRKQGLKGLTMDRVADEAGIAKGTLYLYFKNKDELLRSVVYQCFEPLDDKMLEIAHSDLEPLEKLEQYIFTSLKDADENSRLYYDLRFYLFEITEKEYVDQTKCSGYWQGIALITQTIQEGVKKGIFREMGSERIAILLLDSIYRLMVRRIFSVANVNKSEASVEDDTKLLLDLYVRGMSRTEN